jgi:hypothetical protein
MKENKYLSVDEASEITGKSKNIINNFVKKNFKNNEQLNTKDNKNNHQNIIRKKAPKGFYWFIKESFLKENFDTKKEKNSTEKKDTDIINFLQKRLESQEKQIFELLERQRETNILLKNSQDKNLLLEDKNEIPEKKGFWAKIFK